MELAKYMRGTVTVVELTGELDSTTGPSIREELLQLVAEGSRVLLDLNKVSYMSSAGLRVMLLIYRQAESSGTRVALVGIPVDVRAVMSATGFLRFFTVADSLDQGVEALEG
jgi:anti-sigma B factor antagonist